MEAVMSEFEDVNGLEQLSVEDCNRLLAGAVIGRVGFHADGGLHLLPVNCAAATDGTVVFRTSEHSALARVDGVPVVFEADGFDAATRTGWSVCVHGLGREITQGDDRTARRLLDTSVIPWAPGRRDRWFAIAPEEVTGRRIPLVRAADFGWIPGVVS
jgi:nitroimidazol reductase NimA-like FMN-containing flavoprotein (pyridoxamine 5'-phosphate oxidase superfamily)